MDKEIAINLAFINLNLTWNKLEFRRRLEPKKSEGIEQQQKDLEHVRMVLNHLVTENKILTTKLFELNLELMKANQRINDLRIYEDK